MSLSLNYPTVRPTLLLDFINTDQIDPRITFSRASSATYFNSNGILTTAATNALRRDYNPATLAAQGLLIEEARTNLLTYSALIGGTNWTNQNSIVVTTNTTDVTDPSNTNTASKLVSGSATSQTLQSATLTATVHSASVYLRSLSGTTSVELYVYLTLSPFTVIGSATVTATSTWQRFSFTTSTATATGYTLAIRVPSGTVYAFGAQLEAGAFPTSYIPTTTTALTRSADVASVNTLSPWYNSASGTLYAEGVTNRPYAATTGGQMAQISDGTANNRMWIAQGNTTANTATNSVVTTSGVSVVDINYGPVPSANLLNKSAFAYATNDFAGCANGGTVQTDTSGGVPTVTTLYLGTSATLSSASNWNGYLRRLSYYPVRLSNAQLQAITSA